MASAEGYTSMPSRRGFGALAALGLLACSGLDPISGEAGLTTPILEIPTTKRRRNVTIILVPGSGLNQADYWFGIDANRGNNLFADLSKRLRDAGYTVVRYSEIVGAPDQKSYDETKADALLTGLRTADAYSRHGSHCTLAIAFSEGLHTVSRLLATNSLAKPDGILAFSAPVQDRATVIRWQFTRRLAASLSLLDTDEDGRISKEELELGWSKTPYLAEPAPTFLLSGGQIDLAFVRRAAAVSELMFDRQKSSPGSIVVLQKNAFQASVIAAWISDRTDPIGPLNSSGVPLVLLYGGADTQIDVQSQIDAARQLTSLAEPPSVIPKVGHALGHHQLVGPMTSDSSEALLQGLGRLERRVPACPPHGSA